MMLALNLPLGKRQADGMWGPYTANAWSGLDRMVGGRLGAAPSEKTEGPTAVQIDRAMRVANILMRRQAVVEVAPGVSLPTSAFASVQAFMRALATRRAAGIDTSGSLDTAANRKRALELLRSFASRLEDQDVQLDMATKLGEQEAQRLPQQDLAPHWTVTVGDDQLVVKHHQGEEGLGGLGHDGALLAGRAPSLNNIKNSREVSKDTTASSPFLRPGALCVFNNGGKGYGCFKKDTF